MFAPMPVQIGPPTQYALSRRPWLLASLILQTIVCLLRVAVPLDIIGGFIMAMTIGIGYYGWKDDMNITFIIYWGMLSFINGIFDTIRAIDLIANSPAPVFSTEVPLDIRFANVVILLVPVVELVAVPLAYFLFQDYMEATVVVEPVGAVGGGARGGGGGAAAPGIAFAPGVGRRIGDGDPRFQGTSARGSPAFRAFGGEGRRLSSGS